MCHLNHLSPTPMQTVAVHCAAQRELRDSIHRCYSARASRVLRWYLKHGDCQMTGPIPDSYGTAERLWWLDMGFGNISGGIPITYACGLENPFHLLPSLSSPVEIHPKSLLLLLIKRISQRLAHEPGMVLIIYHNICRMSSCRRRLLQNLAYALSPMP